MTSSTTNCDGPVLVTGSAGFIGFHTSLKLLESGYSVVGVDNFNDYYPVELKRARFALLEARPGFTGRKVELSSIDEVDALFAEFKFPRVCHLAAQAGVRYSLTHPFAYERSNLAAFLNILESSKQHGTQRLAYASSSSVYGGNTKIPFSESDPVDTPISLYAATKKSNELMAHCYSHLFGLETIGLRFFTVYGPWGRPDMAMWLFIEAMKAGKPIKVFNNGDMRRDFTYIDDIVAGVEAALMTEGIGPYDIFNLGNHLGEDLMDMIGILEREVGVVAEKEFLPMQPGDVKETYADIDKARRLLGFDPKTPIKEGIPKFVEWYETHSELTELIRSSKHTSV